MAANCWLIGKVFFFELFFGLESDHFFKLAFSIMADEHELIGRQKGRFNAFIFMSPEFFSVHVPSFL